MPREVSDLLSFAHGCEFAQLFRTPVQILHEVTTHHTGKTIFVKGLTARWGVNILGP